VFPLGVPLDFTLRWPAEGLRRNPIHVMIVDGGDATPLAAEVLAGARSLISRLTRLIDTVMLRCCFTLGRARPRSSLSYELIATYAVGGGLPPMLATVMIPGGVPLSTHLRFGALTPHYPPMEGIAEAAINVAARGLDFVCFGDQLQGTEPPGPSGRRMSFPVPRGTRSSSGQMRSRSARWTSGVNRSNLTLETMAMVREQLGMAPFMPRTVNRAPWIRNVPVYGQECRPPEAFN
jgi:hypothetical protein